MLIITIIVTIRFTLCADDNTNYVVTYSVNENYGGTGSIEEIVVNEKGLVKLESGKNISNGDSTLSFGGWNTEEDGSGIMYTGNTVYEIDSDLTLYAQWVTTDVWDRNHSN